MNEDILSNLRHPWLTVELDEFDRPTITKCTPNAEGTLIIPDGIICIGYQSFKDCELKCVVIPESVEWIQEDAFKDCNDELFNNYDGCKYIGTPWNPYKFLIQPICPNNISACNIHPDCEIICDAAFDGCYNLSSVKFNTRVKEIGVWAFRCSWIFEIEFPNTLNEIPPFCCEHCKNLHKVKIPASVKTISSSAFEGCRNLELVDLPTGIKIEDDAFWGCEKLGSELTGAEEKKVSSKIIDLK